jgi:ribonuclease HI
MGRYGPGTLLHEVLLAGHVAGLIQTAFRAELTAVVEAVRWAKGRNLSVRIWPDCLAVSGERVSAIATGFAGQNQPFQF